MNALPSQAVYWLANYLASGDATPETRVFRAASQAGIELSAWWRLPDSGSAPVPAAMPVPIPEPHQRPRAGVGGVI
jgi:hypothetical protein